MLVADVGTKEELSDMSSSIDILPKIITSFAVSISGLHIAFIANFFLLK